MLDMKNTFNLFFHFALFFVIIMLILEWIFKYILHKKKGISGRKLNLYGLLMEIDNFTIMALAVLSVKLLFTFFTLLHPENVTRTNFIVLIMFSLLYGIFSKSIKNIIIESISSCALYFGFICNGLLYSYMMDVRVVWYVVVGMILLISFIALYSFFFYLRNINNLILKNKYVSARRQVCDYYEKN